MPRRIPERYIALQCELADEFKRGDITEAIIEAPGEHVSGICEGQRIVINPVPEVVDTLLHELLHRRYPRRGEKWVRQTTARLLFYMDTATLRSWYRRYNRTKRTRKTPLSVD